MTIDPDKWLTAQECDATDVTLIKIRWVHKKNFKQ